ncbi:MAG: hypothetical protein KAR33_12450, partial [Candidatus Thorarchaeota archaeon]|nr:hypothetical protein [Candidatus Thorarchaeota archaeon]
PSKEDTNSTIIGVDEEEGGYSSIKVFRVGAVSIQMLTDSLRVDTDAVRFWTSRIVHAEM